MRAWRNGRRARLKICCPYGRGGSSPPARTTKSQNYLEYTLNIINF